MGNSDKHPDGNLSRKNGHHTEGNNIIETGKEFLPLCADNEAWLEMESDIPPRNTRKIGKKPKVSLYVTPEDITLE